MQLATNPTDGTAIAFEQFGDGEPLLLIHGSALSRAVWRGLGYVRAFRDNYRVIIVDLRGHGRSGKPHEQSAYRMPLVLSDLTAVLDTAEAPSAHIVGYSFGARAGFSVLAEHPERALSFVSLGGTYRSPAGSVGELFFDDYDAALGAGGMRAFLDRWSTAAGADIDPHTSAAFLANDPLALRAYFRQVEDEPGLDESVLPGLHAQTLLVAGSADRSRAADSRRAAQLMPNARFALLPGRDHGGTLRPAGEVIGLLREFLSNVSVHSPS